MATPKTLWEQIRDGDGAAFEEFYRQQLPRLRSYLRMHLGSRTAAEDIAQEAFLQLWRNPNGFDPSRSGLRTYLFTMARKRAADWWRRQRPATQSSIPPQSKSDERALIEDLLASLDPDSRSLLWLREVEGYSYQELAGIFDVPVGTVKSRLFVARQRLREIWGRR